MEQPAIPMRARGVAKAPSLARSLHSTLSASRTISRDTPKTTGPRGEPMPPGWITKRSRSQGRYYYVHKASGKSVWEFPTLEPPTAAPPRIGDDDGTPASRLAEQEGGVVAVVAVVAEGDVVAEGEGGEGGVDRHQDCIPLPTAAPSLEGLGLGAPSPLPPAAEFDDGAAPPPPTMMGAGLGLELDEPEPEPEPQGEIGLMLSEVTPPRPSRPLLSRQNTPLSASPRTRSQRRMTARYTQMERRSPFLCMTCMHGLDESTQSRLEAQHVQESLKPRILQDGGHRALLALAQAWWHRESDYNESGQLVAEVRFSNGFVLFSTGFVLFPTDFDLFPTDFGLF